MTQDFLTNIYRMKQLGFDSVRMPYRRTDYSEPWNPRIIEHECTVAPTVCFPWHTQTNDMQAGFHCKAWRYQ